MGVRVSSSKSDERVLFEHFVRRMDVLCDDSVGLNGVVEAFDGARERSYTVRRWYRGGGWGVQMKPAVAAYVNRCLGHRLDRVLLMRFPRLLPLCALVFHEGRWREAEEVVGGDHIACYLYARALGGVLPPPMHNRLVLEGGSVAVRYVADFC